MKLRYFHSIAAFLMSLFFFQIAFAETPKLIHHAEGDIEYSFVQWPAIILVGGGIASAILYRYDEHVQNYFTDHQASKKFDDVMDVAANPFILSGVTAVTYGISLLTENQRLKLFAETLSEALIFNAIMDTGLKYAFQRTRPTGGTLSFPSAHTSTAFTIASVFQSMEGWKYGVPAYTIASAVAFSRLDGNHHHLTDVVFGAALGSCIGWGTSLFHKQENTKLLISPILDQTRGLMLTYKF